VTLLTGGGDQPYAFGLATELVSKGAILDFIGSDDLDCPEFHTNPRVHFLNLRGDQRPDVGVGTKVLRVSKYYVRLIRYALTAESRIFHILWNNKLEFFDRTLLMLYYRLLRKKILLTVHNVNKNERDSSDSFLNRITLRIQYRLADHLFVHTEKMKTDLVEQFGVVASRISVIPFGINNAVPNTSLSSQEARQRLNIRDGEKAILFFGNIAPYKGLDCLTAAFQKLVSRDESYRLIIAGRPKDCEDYWKKIQEDIQDEVQTGRVIVKAEYVADDETEIYFKAADVLVLPYRYIYQSGVLFLGYSFGLPVLAADVGSLKEEIVEGKTGFVFAPEDPANLAETIERYFASDLFANLDTRRREIRDFATERHSWDVVGKITVAVYDSLVGESASKKLSDRDGSTASLNVKAPL
jgi:D-inositol-3-phosphate glycosyltransferase